MIARNKAGSDSPETRLGSRKIIRDEKWPDENGLFEVLGLENLAHGACTDREGYVILHSPEYCLIVLMGEPSMRVVCSKIRTNIQMQ